jgi:hypothetical protein
LEVGEALARRHVVIRAAAAGVALQRRSGRWRREQLERCRPRGGIGERELHKAQRRCDAALGRGRQQRGDGRCAGIRAPGAHEAGG